MNAHAGREITDLQWHREIVNESAMCETALMRVGTVYWLMASYSFNRETITKHVISQYSGRITFDPCGYIDDCDPADFNMIFDSAVDAVAFMQSCVAEKFASMMIIDPTLRP